MIVSKDVNPKLDLYYLGALILNEMEKMTDAHDTLELYEKIKERETENKLKLFFLSLDWLYTLGVIELAENGFVKKMFLKDLTIENNNDVIRRIEFHKGINLIIDEGPLDTRTESGNSVGKTTVLRLIDFCLAGDGKNIYSDPEFKRNNEIVKNFLTENNITITLKLVESIDKSNSTEVKIKRNFLSYSQKIQQVNDESVSNEEFPKLLKKLIFKSSKKYPTFKQLKSKNIRDEKDKLNNTIRVLSANVVTDAVYETLHCFGLVLT